MLKNAPSTIVALLACCSVGLGASALSAWAELPSGQSALLQQTPLAECRVQTLATRAAPATMAARAAPRMRRPAANDPLANYARTQDGQWPIAQQVDRQDPWLRLLLLGPHQPLIVDLAVLLDGRPYRSVREQWLDRLLARAQGDASEPSAATQAASASSSPPAANHQATEQTEKQPTVPTRVRQPPSVEQRLKNYLAASGAQADRQELRWLVAEWTGGPGLLTLGPALAWQRAATAPLWNYLDADGDRVLSSAEMHEAFARLGRADIDEDDVVLLEELRRTSAVQSSQKSVQSNPLLVVLDENTHWPSLRRMLAEQYGLRDADLLRRKPPDIALRVDFGQDGAALALLTVGSAAGDAARVVSASQQVITVALTGAYLELSAAQRKDDDRQYQNHQEAQQTQIAVGAVVDGYPLFRLLDRDNDRRLTLRERRQLERCLAALDTDGDGKLSPDEIPTAIRLAVTQGPYVHEHLRAPTAAMHEVVGTDRLAAPAWFSSMDRNGDGDLSRGEFLGTAAQFNRFDADGDGLIGIAEAEQLSNQ